MAVYSIIQRHGWDPYMWGGVITWQRVIGTIGQPNFLAAYMLMAFFLNLAMILIRKQDFPSKINWVEQLVPVGYFVFTQVTFIAMIYSLDAHNVLLWYFGFIVITASALMFTYSYDKLHPWVLNAVLGIGLILNYVCILYTQSRGGYMGLFTGASLFVIIAGRKWILANWKKIIALTFTIFLITGITMSNPQFSPFKRFSDEITTEKEGAGRTMELKGAAGSRGETWKSSFQIIANYPVFGIGPEVLKMVFPRYETDLFRFKEAFHVKQDRAHNEIFDVSVTKGLVTFFVYLWLLFMVFRTGWVRSRLTNDQSEKLMMAGLLAAAVAFLIQNQFSFGVVAITSLFWMIWAMIMVIGKNQPEAGQEKEINWLDIPWLPIAGVIVLAGIAIYISFFSFRGDVHFKTGKVNVQLRNLDQGVKCYEKSLDVFPYEGGTVSHLGIAYMNLSRTRPDRKKYLNKSIETLKYGTVIDPYNADNYYILSKIYYLLYKMGDQRALAQAQNHAEIAIKIDPYYAEVYHVLGLIYETQNRELDAIKRYKKAFFINPGLTQPMQSLEGLNKRLGRPGDTLKVFEEARRKYSTNLIILERVGRLYLSHGKVKESMGVAEDMIDIDPKSSPGYLLRAEINMKRGLNSKAFSDLQQVLIADPKNVMARNGLGRIYYLKGDHAKAKREFEQALMLLPNNPYAKEMLKKLR